jgi:hypothetical protein
MASYEETGRPAARTAAQNVKKDARKSLPSSDDTGYAQAIAGGTVNAPAGKDVAVKPNYLPDDGPALPSAPERNEGDRS